jgi:lactoylglutathione lyase
MKKYHMNDSPKSGLNVRQAVPFFMVADMDKSLAFYVGGLGFKKKHTWDPNGKLEWCWLQLDDASIMLQQYKNVPDKKPGEGVSIYFICEDALKIYKQIASAGLSASEPFVGNKMWVTGLKDPDGYQIYFESPTDVPEETMFTEWAKTI